MEEDVLVGTIAAVCLWVTLICLDILLDNYHHYTLWGNC